MAQQALVMALRVRQIAETAGVVQDKLLVGMLLVGLAVVDK
jgi:hypothetical protein